jgi:hypothetical protein
MSVARQLSFIPSKLTIQERFERWLRDNPKILPLFLKFAREVRARGIERYGMHAIAERVRWHVNIEMRGDEPFKVNDHFTSRLARKVTEIDPSLAGMFETRRLRS